MWARSWGLVLCLVVAAPLLALLRLWPDSDTLSHLWSFVVPEVLTKSLWVWLGVTAGTLVLGLSTAFLSVFVGLPGPRGLWTFLFLMPLALPSYVVALGWVSWLDWGGPQNSLLGFAWPVRSLLGLCLVLSLCLYPYIYLWARYRFLEVAQHWDAASSLGLNVWKRVWRVLRPLSQRAILGALVLVSLETLADMGAAMVLGQNTWSVSIYRSWHGLQSLEAAAFQSLGLVGLGVLAFVSLPKSVADQRRTQCHRKSSRWIRFCSLLWCALVVLSSWIVPLAALILNAWSSSLGGAALWEASWGSFLLGVLVASLVVGLALVSIGLLGQPLPKWVQWTKLGYALPGAVLAVGFYSLLAWLQVPWLSLGLFSLTLALAIRFFAVGVEPLEDAVGRFSKNYSQAAQVLGLGTFERLRRLWWPELRSPIMAAWLIVALDVLKELPLTLMLRSADFSVLSVVIAEWASEGRLSEASHASLGLVALGVGLTAWLARGDSRGSEG